MEDGYLLRIFIGEADKHDNMPLYEWIVQQARHEKLAGATVLRGIEGFGTHNEVHTIKILHLATTLPIVIEIVDTQAKIEKFMAVIESAVKEGLATLEKVQMKFLKNTMPH